MRSRMIGAILTLSACEDPCPQGARRVGSSCRPSARPSVIDAGPDAGGNDGSAGDGDGANGMDGGADSSTPLVPECTENAECGENELCSPTQQCVECTDENTELCPEGKPNCHQGTCVACASSELHCANAGASLCQNNVCVPCGGPNDCNHIDGRPFCEEQECVQCRSNQDCGAGASVCSDGECVACTADTDGIDDGTDEDCEHLEDTPACFEGKCVECTKDKRARCAGGDNACDALKHTCSQAPVESANACDECVSDSQCKPGHACVQTVFSGDVIDGKYYCLPIRGANCLGRRPFSETISSVVSIDSATTSVCGLGVSTCAAVADYRRKSCGVDAEGEPIPVDNDGLPVAAADSGDDNLCGLPGLSDGYCREDDTGVYYCTVACAATLAECPDDPLVTEQCQLTAHGDGSSSRNLCTW